MDFVLQVLIIADDLTGALDSAVTLAAGGLRCTVARRPSDLTAAMETRPDVLAVSTASREGGKAAARAAVDEVLAAAAEATPGWLFKKVDSRLKGHVAAELNALAGRRGIRRALVAPAIPAQGRIIESGRLTGAGIAAPIDVAARFAGSGCDLTIPDTRNDADLDAALAGSAGRAPALLVGAAGLAAALARHLAPGGRGPRLDPFPAPMLLAIGSRDPITLAQVDALRAGRRVAEMRAPGGSLAGPRPAEGVVLLHLVEGGTAREPGEVGARFARAAAELLSKAKARTLFACGGETADGILGELGAGVLMVEGELLPGVPVSRMVADGRDMLLVTKSGGFGGPDTLIAVVDAADGRETAP